MVTQKDNGDLDIFLEMIRDLYRTSKEKLGFSESIKLSLLKDDDNAHQFLGKTGAYNPEEQEIVLYFVGRHPKDLMRSFSHELVHHSQNCRGDLANIGDVKEGYAQSNSHLREMEREAYEIGNIIFRDWEDKTKKEGVVPLFHNSPFATIQMGYNENLGEDTMSKKKLNETHLRDIIRGVIQEMFDEDLTEDGNAGLPGLEDAERDEAATATSQAAQAAATITAAGEETGEDYQVQSEDSGEEEKSHYHDDATNDDEHIDAIRHHLDALEHDKDYDDRHEPLEEDDQLNESFFPHDRDIRSKARAQTYSKLVNKWCK
tara:strand:- start:2536 stop:3486 length:951 start_codon:yes stop_codon:yes gene_type:complete